MGWLCTAVYTRGEKLGQSARTPRQRPFTEDRYRVEVLSDTQRIITPMVGDTAGHSDWYICHTPYEEGEIACEEGPQR